jgi:hypothetical protein
LSGEEKTEGVYNISNTPESSGRFMLTLETLKDYGGRDCAGKTQSTKGENVVIYIQFNSKKNMMLQCYKDSGWGCFGPLEKK